MRYVEFVQEVFGAASRLAAVKRDEGLPPFVSASQIGECLLPGQGFDSGNPPQLALLGVMHAIEDLKALGLVDGNQHRLSLPEAGNILATNGGDLRLIWSAIFKSNYIDEDQRTVLEVIANAGERQEVTFGSVVLIDVYGAMAEAGLQWDPYRRMAACKALLDKRIFRGVLTSEPQARPAYAGFILAFEQEATELQELIRRLLVEGETASVEFKRQLNLGTMAGNTEFARDMMALANSKVSGADRYLLVGVDNRSRLRVAEHDPTHSQERMEQILNEYLDRTPRFRLHTGTWQGGTIGVIRVRRDPLLIPHRWKKDAGGLQKGAVKVRHGSHVMDPGQEELDDLEAEGGAARAVSQA